MNALPSTVSRDARSMFISFVLVLLATLMLIPGALLAESEKDSQLEELRITLTLDKTPLQMVVNDIHKQTGFTLLFSESLVSLPVTGIYNDISIDEFLRRALRGKNISVISDDKEKILVVKAFGDKVIYAHNGKISQDKLNEMVPGMDLTFDELRQQEEANKLAIDEALNNPETIDPVSGLTLGEIRAQEGMNKEALEKALNDPQTVVPHSGDLTVEQTREIEAQNTEELARRMNDPNTVDPVTGLKLSELRAIEAENQRVLDEALKNPDTIDPMTGLTLREMRAQENVNQ